MPVVLSRQLVDEVNARLPTLNERIARQMISVLTDGRLHNVRQKEVLMAIGSIRALAGSANRKFSIFEKRCSR